MSHYCLLCGNQLSQRKIENRHREICQTCGWINYDQLKVTAGVLVECDNRILLVKRAIEPWKGYWYLPAGYVEGDEQPKLAAEREGIEETNLIIKASDLIDVYFYNDDPRGNGLLILYLGKIIGGEIKTNNEADEIRFFHPSEIPSLKLAGGSHDKAIHNWQSKKSQSG
jgi:ADP-ribose pyrophosphatase YjhB (NUDIX family)